MLTKTATQTKVECTCSKVQCTLQVHCTARAVYYTLQGTLFVHYVV